MDRKAAKLAPQVRYSDRLRDRICAELASGEPARQVFLQPGMPDQKTHYRWMAAREDYHNAVIAAKVVARAVKDRNPVAKAVRHAPRGASVRIASVRLAPTVTVKVHVGKAVRSIPLQATPKATTQTTALNAHPVANARASVAKAGVSVAKVVANVVRAGAKAAVRAVASAHLARTMAKALHRPKPQ